MDLTEWGGVIGFAVAVCGSVLAWRLILRRQPQNTDSSGDKQYDKLVMQSILPNGYGIPIDEVAKTLKDQDLADFGLTTSKGDTQK